MFKIFIALFVMFFMSGCFSNAKPPKTIKANEKAFEEEDRYILFALRAEELKDYESASLIFNTLWKKSAKKEYLYRSLQNDLAANKNRQVINRIDKIIDNSIDDYKLTRFKIVALIGDGDLQSARILSIELVEASKEMNDYILVSEIYVKQKKFNTALKYLESAYIKNYSEKILDRMAIVLYVNLGRKKDAIAQLETHSRVHGCSKTICRRLLGLYSNENNIKGLLSTYLRLYKLDKNSEIAKKIVQIYTYQKKYIKLLSFLKESKSDDELLLRIYIDTKNYKEAATLAHSLYSETGDLNHLGQSAIFEYESNSNKNDKKMQDSVVQKLKEVVSLEKRPLYLNYLGYLLIDHSIDIKEGMRFVREALKIESGSVFYLDSLAWGYYRLGNCKKALEIINRVMKLDGGSDPEVLEHAKAIQECKNKKGKK